MDKNIAISDIKLSSYLVASGFSITDVSRQGRHCDFIFISSVELDEAIRAFKFANPQVGVRELFNAWNQLKSLIYDG